MSHRTTQTPETTDPFCDRFINDVNEGKITSGAELQMKCMLVGFTPNPRFIVGLVESMRPTHVLVSNGKEVDIKNTLKVLREVILSGYVLKILMTQKTFDLFISELILAIGDMKTKLIQVLDSISVTKPGLLIGYFLHHTSKMYTAYVGSSFETRYEIFEEYIKLLSIKLASLDATYSEKYHMKVLDVYNEIQNYRATRN